jgi:hypothetical protein
MGKLMQKQAKTIFSSRFSLPFHYKFPKTKLLIQIEYFPDAVEAVETNRRMT